jgi:hypothetical protein
VGAVTVAAVATLVAASLERRAIALAAVLESLHGPLRGRRPVRIGVGMGETLGLAVRLDRWHGILLFVVSMGPTLRPAL